MTVKNFKQLIEATKNNPPIKMAIAMPHNEHVLESLYLATKEGLIIPYISGNKKLIEEIALQNKISLDLFHIVDTKDNESINRTIDLIKQGECQLLMKGDHPTASIMSPVLKTANGLKVSHVLSHIYLLEVPTYHKFLYITDAALNIAPNLTEQIGIIKNAIKLANILGNNMPKIALLSAVETPTPKMPSTVLIEYLSRNLELKKLAILEGPIAFDAAINKEASIIKHMQSEISGDIDIALVPYIEAGNILAKSLIYLAKAKAAGLILGAKVPIILTSRSDSIETKFLSIALASLYVNGDINV